MYIDKILEVVNGKLLTDKKIKKINKIRFDSRKICKNDLYICIIGKNNDGHDYIFDAIKAGCAAIITSRDIESSVTTIKVDDTLEALKALASYKRLCFKGKVIAVTGSVGKTTTKEMIVSILKNKYNVLYSKGNKNNVYGLSETLFDINKKTEILVLEMGMNHFGEINELSNICRPDIALITNIGTSHIGNLKNRKNIYKAKMEILSGLNDGLLIVNGYDKYLKKIKYKNCAKILYNEIFIDENIKFTFKVNNKMEEFEIKFPIKEYVVNALLAISVGLKLNVNLNCIKNSIKNYQAYDRRYKIYTGNSIYLIDDSYNSSYESLKASVNSLNLNDKKLLIIGDILELGKKSRYIHKKIGKLLNISNSCVLVVGNNMKILRKKYKHFNNSYEVIDYISNIDISNITVLIKGSNKIKLDLVANYLINKYGLQKN